MPLCGTNVYMYMHAYKEFVEGVRAVGIGTIKTLATV